MTLHCPECDVRVDDGAPPAAVEDTENCGECWARWHWDSYGPECGCGAEQPAPLITKREGTPTMLTRLVRTFAALGVVMALACSACTPLKDVIWPTTVKCLTTPATALAAEVQAIVERDGLDAVFSSQSLDALEDLARSYGPEAVVCVIKELIDAYTAPTGMAAPPDRLAAARRAQDFLNERDIVVQEASP